MARTELTVTVKYIYTYSVPTYNGYRTEDRYIYTFIDEDGKTYVWKTGVFAGMEVEDPKGWIIYEDKTCRFDPINNGDIIRIAATIKGESEYKGQPQTVINRVKVLERIFKAKTREEIKAEKEAEKEVRKAEQLASITDEDLVWTMPYRQYKEHYSDCETVIDSFTRHRSGANTITVIIRAGRLKESGVRGKRFSNYEFTFCVDGESMSDRFYAVSPENAVKQLTKKYKNATAIMEAYHY